MTYTIGLIVGIACAVGCSAIASSKGRGRILWGILGFFFTLIALVVIALMPRKRALY